MRRSMFITGSLLAAAAASNDWWAHFGQTGADVQRHAGAETLPDGRLLVRGAALAFGTTVSIAAVHRSPNQARRAIAAALDQTRRVDALMTVYRPDSQVGRLNAAGALGNPDPHLVRVLKFAQGLSALSNGAFDVTVQPLWRLFADCQRKGRIPSRDEVASARALAGRRWRSRRGGSPSSGLAWRSR